MLQDATSATSSSKDKRSRSRSLDKHRKGDEKLTNKPEKTYSSPRNGRRDISRDISSDRSDSCHTNTSAVVKRKIKSKRNGESVDMGIKNMEVLDSDNVIHTVEITKRPGQSLGFYIREGNGQEKTTGVFISRIAAGSVVEHNGLLRPGDEILTINTVDVTHMNLDDVVVLMSIPKKLILTVRTCSLIKSQLCANTGKDEPPKSPVVILKKGVEHLYEDYAHEDCQDDFMLAARSSNDPYSRHLSVGYCSPVELHQQEIRLRSFQKHVHLDECEKDDSNDSGLSSETAGSSHISKYMDSPNVLTTDDDAGGSPGVSPRSADGSEGKMDDPSRRPSLTKFEVHGILTQSPKMKAKFDHLRKCSDPTLKEAISANEPEKSDPIPIKGFINTKHRHSRFQRLLSPDCYNSDSEVLNSSLSSREKGSSVESACDSSFDSDHYSGSLNEDGRSNSLPKISDKFSSLPRRFMQSYNHENDGCTTVKHQDAMGGNTGYNLENQMSDPQPHRPHLSQYGDIYTSQEYHTWLTSSPKAANKLSNGDVYDNSVHTALNRKYSADSLMRYRTYQNDDFTSEQKYATLGHAGATKARSHSASFIQYGDPKSFVSQFREMHLSRVPLRVRTEEFEPYTSELERRKLQKEGGIGQKGLDGQLLVNIFCGHGLKSSQATLKDLYCVLDIDNVHKAKTGVRTGAVNFDWDESFEIDVENGRRLNCMIYNWDPHTRHKLSFNGTIYLHTVFKKSKSRKISIKLEPKGILYLHVTYKEPSVVLRRTPSMKSHALFGVGLETIVQREKSGLGVPLIIHKCLLQIEERGLGVIGIYRLCGSAKKKLILRQMFEADAAGCDVSADCVPDINVITGVLKDFLRELPEPLFTNALCKMLLDALRVRMPSDEEGSAKLMLNILECLPKANQNTMVTLLDHLKTVARHCDINKMSVTNLAICFGPVLLCPSPTVIAGSSTAMDFKGHMEVLRYLLDIWPDQRDLLISNTQDTESPALTPRSTTTI